MATGTERRAWRVKRQTRWALEAVRRSEKGNQRCDALVLSRVAEGWWRPEKKPGSWAGLELWRLV